MDGRNQQRWFAAVVIMFMFLGTKAGMTEKVCAGCSCYTFHTDMKTGFKSKEDCTTNNGSLVVMETVEEWKFINRQIQKITVSDGEGNNEWFIGLTGKTTGDWKRFRSRPAQTKSRRDGWTWGNGKKLTIDKWQPREPTGETTEGGDACVVMAKNYPAGKPGLFNDLVCTQLKPCICEYTKDCKKTESTTIQQTTTATFTPSISVQSSTITTPTSKPQTTTKSTTLHTSTTKPTTSKPLSSFRTFNKVTTVKPVPKTSTFKPSLSTTTTSPTRKQSEERQSFEKGFPLDLIIIVLCVLLSVGICLVLAVCFWRRQKKAKTRKSSDNSNRSNRCKQTGEVSTATTNNINEIINDSSFVAFTMFHNNLTHTKTPTEDPENTTVRIENNMSVTMETPLTTNSGETQIKQEPLYASVDKSKKFSIKKKKSSRRVNSKRKSKVKMEEAPLPSNSCEANEAVYATVAKDKQQQPQPQIVYADLAEFNNNGSSPPVKPAPYQPVEYAVIIGKKVSN